MVQTRMVDLNSTSEECPLCKGERKILNQKTDKQVNCIACSSRMLTEQTINGGELSGSD